MAQKSKKKGSSISVGLILLIILTLGIAALFIFRKKKPPVVEAAPVTVNVNTSTATSTPAKKVVRNDNFPLQKGSLGTRVKQLQQALITKYGASILPKFGADGDFGSETESALSSKGIKTVLNETDYNGLLKSLTTTTQTVTTSAIDYRKDAARLKTAFEDITGTDNAVVLDLLKPSRNSNYLKTLRDTYDKSYGGAGALIKRLREEQDFNEFNAIINNLETL